MEKRLQPANLILFQADSHNRNLLGCYDHPIVQTPNLDRIAANGVRFENAYCASPLCCPSRAALATGRYPSQTGYWDNCLAYNGRIESWMHRIREQGHTVVSIGKLHFRSTDDDNGLTEEKIPMHLVDGVGGLVNLLRWNEEEPTQPYVSDLWVKDSKVGNGSDYQDYDREITRLSVEWLKNNTRTDHKRPWVLIVSFISPHPPFTLPQRFWDMYQPEKMPLPMAFRPGEWPEHPACQHFRNILGITPATMQDEDMLRKVAAGYYGLITRTDEMVGQVLKTAEELGLMENTRVAYTSDHGDSYGNHGLFGNGHMFESALAVPLIISGPGVPKGQVSNQIVSQVDLFPTIVEGVGAALKKADSDLSGISLWPAIEGQDKKQLGFAEYHGYASLRGSFMLREENYKLIYHVGMPSQLYDLETDPMELYDLAADGRAGGILEALEAKLRSFGNPEEFDRQAKADQKAFAEKFGGNEAIKKMGGFVRTTPPSVKAQMHPVF